MADFLKDRFPDFEHLHFSDDNKTLHGDNIAEREPVMEDNNNHKEDRVSEPDEDLAETQSCTATDMEAEIKNCSRNSMDGLLEDQRMKTGTMLFGSWSDYDSDERKTQAEDHEEECKEDELEMLAKTSDIHKMIPHVQVEDVSFLEKVPSEETHTEQGTPKYQIITEEETSHLLSCQMVDEPEDKSSSSSEDRMLMDVQSRDEMKEFTEDDHVGVEEGLADYPSGLSESENESSSESHEGDPPTESENESSSESHEGDPPTNMNIKVDADNLEADCLAIASMDDDNERNQREDSEPDEDLAETQSCTDTDMEEETKNCSRNSVDGLLEDQSVKTGTMLFGSWSDDNSDERQKQAEEECKEDELEIPAETSDIHQITAHVQVEDVGLLEKVPPEETHNDSSSASEDDRMDPETFEEHVFQHAPDNKDFNDFKQVKLEDSPTQLMEVQSRDKMKEFTEDDHVGVEEGLADYPSDLSESENESSSEGHEGDPNIKVDADNLEADFLVIASMDDDNERKDRGINPAEMVTDSGNAENAESYINEQPDYDSDISSDDDNNSPTVYIHETIASHEPENPFTNDFVRDWKSIECEEAYIEDIHADSQKSEIHDAGGLSDTPAFPGAGTSDSRMESPSAYETHTSENLNISVRQLDPSKSNSNVSNIGENLNTFLPETFLNLIEEDNLKFDEYNWDVNEEEAICNEEDNFLEDLENEEEEMERDWEKERARIEAFNTYYTSLEGEDNVGRSHKVTFCLETESIQYEDEYTSSEEEPSTNISELHPADPSSDAADNIHTVPPDTLWSSKLLTDEDNLKFNECDHDIDGDYFHKPDTSNAICDEKELFLEELKNEGQEIKGDGEQEHPGAEAFNRYMYHIEFTEWENEVTDRSHKDPLNLDQESSQNEDNESSEQESNTEDDTSNIKTEDLSESDEPRERRLYIGRQKVLPKGLQSPDKKLKEPKSKCLVLLRSVLAVSLATAVGVLSYWWVTDSLDWIY